MFRSEDPRQSIGFLLIRIPYRIVSNFVRDARSAFYKLSVLVVMLIQRVAGYVPAVHLGVFRESQFHAALAIRVLLCNFLDKR